MQDQLFENGVSNLLTQYMYAKLSDSYSEMSWLFISDILSSQSCMDHFHI